MQVTKGDLFFDEVRSLQRDFEQELRALQLYDQLQNANMYEIMGALNTASFVHVFIQRRDSEALFDLAELWTDTISITKMREVYDQLNDERRERMWRGFNVLFDLIK